MADSTELLHELIGAVNSLRLEVQRMNKNMSVIQEEHQKVMESCKVWGEWMEKDGPLVQLNLTYPSKDSQEESQQSKQGGGDAPDASMEQEQAEESEPPNK